MTDDKPNETDERKLRAVETREWSDAPSWNGHAEAAERPGMDYNAEHYSQVSCSKCL